MKNVRAYAAIIFGMQASPIGGKASTLIDTSGERLLILLEDPAVSDRLDEAARRRKS